MEPSGTWIRASSRDGYTYHPDDEPLPRARGLQTLELHRDGVAEVRRPGADDRHGTVTGRWTWAGEDQVKVALEESVRYFTLVDEGDADAARLVPETAPEPS